MKKLIVTMTIFVMMGQPILAGPLSMDTIAVNGDPKLQDASNLDGTAVAWGGRGDSSSVDGLQRTGTKYVNAPAQNAERIQVIKGTNWTRILFGGTLAFSLLSWQQFDRASDNEAEAALNREHGQLSRAQKLDDKADRARLYGWSTAVLAVGSFGVALISRKTTHRVFPGLSFRDGEPCVGVSYVYSF